MPLQYIQDNTIGDQLSQLGNTIAAGPQTQLHAAVAGEQIRTSQQKRMELQNQLDAKAAIADLTNNIDQLREQKRLAGANWTPDQETQLIGATTKFGEAVTKSAALQGTTAQDTVRGVYESRGQQRRDINPAAPGTAEYGTQMAQVEGKLPPVPTKEEKAPYTQILGDGTGRTISVLTHDGQRNAYTGNLIKDEVPAGFTAIGIGSPMAVPTQGYGSKEKNANDLLVANQQIINGQTPTEALPSLAQKLYDLNPTKHQLQNDKFGGQMVVGFNSEAPNPGLEAIQQHLAANYYGKGNTSKVNPATAPATASATGGVPAQSVMAGGQQPPQAAATATPALPEGITKLPDGRVVWRPSAAPELGAAQQLPGGVSVQQASRGFSQPLEQQFTQNQIAKDWRISDEAYNEMQSAAKYNSKAADLHMIYLIAKIFDPGSAVREGELVLGQGTQSPANRFMSLWNQVKGGGSLSDTAKEDLLNQAYTSANARFGAAVNLAKDVNSQILASKSLDPAEHLPREMVQPALHNKNEINRFAGAQVYNGKGVGETGEADHAELIRIAGQIVGGAPGQTSTSAAGAPPAAGAIPAGRSGISAAIAPQAPQSAPPATRGAQPAAPGNPLLDWADSLTGRKRAQ